MTFTQEGKRRAVLPTPNLHSHTAVLSYVASCPWTIPKPALIKNYAKVFAITKEIPFFLDIGFIFKTDFLIKAKLNRSLYSMSF